MATKPTKPGFHRYKQKADLLNDPCYQCGETNWRKIGEPIDNPNTNKREQYFECNNDLIVRVLEV